jgi:hypothetical protein
MALSRLLRAACAAACVGLLAACAAPPRPSYDYAAFKASQPKSILVLPPVNNSPDINATWGVWAQATYPLAESGYYVLPVTLVAETFKQNGLSNANDIHAVAPAKLQAIFGADAALYITITRYGSTYTVFDSATVVAANAKLVDLKTGQLLWAGAASASNAENNNNGGGGLVGVLITAVVKQIINSVSDASYPVAGVASQRLLFAGRPAGLLYGPRSPKYGSD